MNTNVITFECPHCGRPQTKAIPKMADIEVKCTLCKGSIGIITNGEGDPIRIGQLTSLSKLLNSAQKQDVVTNPSGVIKAGKGIKAGSSIEAEGSIEAGESIEAGKSIKAGSSQKQDVITNPSGVNIGTMYGGSVYVGGTTNIYNEIINLVDKSETLKPEQKSQAKNVLEYVKNNASPFLPIIAEAIKKAFGL